MDLLFRDCDKKTNPPIPSSMLAKFAPLIEACGLKFHEISSLAQQESCINDRSDLQKEISSIPLLHDEMAITQHNFLTPTINGWEFKFSYFLFKY